MNDIQLIVLLLAMFFVLRTIVKILNEVVGNHRYNKGMWDMMERWTIRTDKAILNMRKRDENILRRISEVKSANLDAFAELTHGLEEVSSATAKMTKKSATLENCINQAKNDIFTIKTVLTTHKKIDDENNKILKFFESTLQNAKSRSKRN